MKRNFILWLLVISCSFIVSCSDNDGVNSDVTSSEVIVFNEINSQIDILNDKYLSDSDLLTRVDDNKKIKWWKVAKADLAGAAVGAGTGSILGGAVGASIVSVIFGTVYSFDEYWKQAEKKDGGTSGGDGGTGGGDKEGDSETGGDGKEESAEVSMFDVNRLYPIRDTPKLEELENFEFTDAGYYHNEIIKYIITNDIFSAYEISYDDLLNEVIYVASKDFFEVPEYIQPYLFDSFFKSLNSNILYSDDLVDQYDMYNEIIIIRKYYDTVVQLCDFNEAYEYTINFMSEVNDLLIGEPRYETSLEIINSSVSIAIYSRMLWNLYEEDPVLAGNYRIFNKELGEWE